MIQFPRSLASRLVSVFRRAGIRHSGSLDPPVRFDVEPQMLRIRARDFHQVVIEYQHPGDFAADDQMTFSVPLSVLVEAEGHSSNPMSFEPVAGGQVRVRWLNGAVPQERLVEVPDRKTDEFPDMPEHLAENPAALRQALADATTCTDQTNTARYSLHTMLLSGGTGRIAATDGRHMLVQRGFEFPWKEDVMLPASRLFQSSEISAAKPLKIGRSGDWIVFASGNWLFYLHRLVEGRFPRYDDLLSDPAEAKTTVTFGGRDADFLRRSLECLPVEDESHLPVTLDLNGEVAVCARAAENSPPTELVLADSRYTGEAVRVALNRKYLARAVKLGFTQVSLNGEEKPVFCDDGSRQYVWMTLGASYTVPPSAGATRVVSSVSDGNERPTNKRSRSTNHEPQSTIPMKTTEQPTTESPSATTATDDVVSQPQPVRKRRKAKPATAGTLEQAIAVRDALREAMVKSHELVRTLKRHKKHSRIVQSTLASLKELQAVA